MSEANVYGYLNPGAATPLTVNYVAQTGTYYWICLYSNGADVGSRYSMFVPANGSTTLNPGVPPPGTYTLRAYTAQNGGTVLFESAPFTVPTGGTVSVTLPAETGTLSGVPSSATVGSPLVGTGTGNAITFNASNVATPYAALVTSAATVGQAVGSALIGSAVALSGSSGTVPAITPPAAATDYLALLDGPTGKVLALSAAITVTAAPAVQPVTLAGLPASIAAGQPLSGVTYTLNGTTPTYGAFVLWDATAGAEEGLHWTDSVTPDSTLDVLVPQNAGHSYTVRLVSIGQPTQTTLWESAPFSVTAAPGALPAQVGPFSIVTAGAGSDTLSWPAVAGATGYAVLARGGAGSGRWGTIANSTVSTPSVTFTGLTSGQTLAVVVTPLSANGRGPANEYFGSAV